MYKEGEFEANMCPEIQNTYAYIYLLLLYICNVMSYIV